MPSLHSPKIEVLIVDDEVQARELLSEFCRAQGYEVATANDGRAAIAALTRLWLALVTVEQSGAVSVNLRAPIVINPGTMMGQQVLPHDCLYPLRHVLVDAE